MASKNQKFKKKRQGKCKLIRSFCTEFLCVSVGFESQAAQPCPPALIGRFTYTHDSGSTQTCSSSSSLAVCPSWDTMTFDYTKCSTEQAFSSSLFIKMSKRRIFLKYIVMCKIVYSVYDKLGIIVSFS